jgi:hypothetical protein
MKLSSIPVSACLFLALAACSPTKNPPSPTSVGPGTDTVVPATPTETKILPTNTPSGPVGTISGKIIPIGSAQPGTDLKIFVREKNQGTMYTLDIPVDRTEYAIGGIPPGVYNVFAWYYPDGLAGSYSSAKITFAGTSSDQFTCTNSLQDLTLSVGSLDFSGADISCWGGDYFSYIGMHP